MSRNILRTTEVTLIIKILGTTERTIIIKLQGNNTGCMPVLLQKGYYQDLKGPSTSTLLKSQSGQEYSIYQCRIRKGYF